MIYPKNKKCFNFPESLANKKRTLYGFKMFKVFPFSFPWVPSQFRTVCVALSIFTYIGEQNNTGANFQCPLKYGD